MFCFLLLHLLIHSLLISFCIYILCTVINSNGLITTTNQLLANLASDQYISLGHFDQCLSVSGYNNIENTSFRGKYCLAILSPPSKFSLKSFLYYDGKFVVDSNRPNVTKANNYDNNNNAENYLNETVRNWLMAGHRMPMVLPMCAPSLCTAQQLNTLLNQCNFYQFLLLYLIYSFNNICNFYILIDFQHYLLTLNISVGYCQQGYNQPLKKENSQSFGLLLSK